LYYSFTWLWSWPCAEPDTTPWSCTLCLVKNHAIETYRSTHYLPQH
jgi:hypothetical protein